VRGAGADGSCTAIVRYASVVRVELGARRSLVLGLGLLGWPSSASAGMGSDGVQRSIGGVGGKRLSFRIEHVGRVWHISDFVCFLNQSSARKEYAGKSELVGGNVKV